MANFERTKWADYKFNKDEKTARALWRRANEYFVNLTEALQTSPEKKSREEMHERLDYVLDNIDRTRKAATDLFPEVGDSFSVAVMEI